MLFGSSEVPRGNFRQNICDIWRGSSSHGCAVWKLDFLRSADVAVCGKVKKALLTGTPHHGTRRRANVPRSQQLIRHRAPHRAPSKRPHRKFRPEPSLRRVPQPALPSHSFTQCCDFSETPTRDWVRPRITNMSHPNPIIRRAPSRHATMTRLESRTLSWDVRMPRGGASPGSPFHNELLPGTLFRDFPRSTIPLPPQASSLAERSRRRTHRSAPSSRPSQPSASPPSSTARRESPTSSPTSGQTPRTSRSAWKSTPSATSSSPRPSRTAAPGSGATRTSPRSRP